MPHAQNENEEHELPSIEAVLAGTLALMTGYSQSLQAALQPEHRVLMSAKIGSNLSLLIDHPDLSGGFRKVLCGLCQRWQQMSACTEEACPQLTTSRGGTSVAAQPPLRMAAPKRLQ